MFKKILNQPPKPLVSSSLVGQFIFVVFAKFAVLLTGELKFMTFDCFHLKGDMKDSLDVASSAMHAATHSRSFPNDFRLDSQNWLAVVVGPLRDSLPNRGKEDADDDTWTQDEGQKMIPQAAL